MNNPNKEFNTIINKENINKNKNKNKNIYLEKLENRAKIKLIIRYDKPIWYHDVKMINDILYNEKNHYVEIFKEFLIYEDFNEFLKQYYDKSLLRKKLEKILNFYDKYSKIFPNYTVIRESKYLYKNIKRKQKVINQMHENKKIKYFEEDNCSENESNVNTIFNSKILNSIYSGDNTPSLNKTEINLTNNKSIESFINKISIFEKIQEDKKNKEKTKKKEEKNSKNKNKNEDQLIYKKIISPVYTSLLNSSSNNSIIKYKLNKDNKKNVIENNISNIMSNKIIFKNIPKQKSSTSIISKNKKKCASIKHKNIIKKSSNNSIIDSNNILNKQNNSNIYLIFYNNINNSYRSNNIKNCLDFDKYKKIILSTNNTTSHKILTDRVLFSSPIREKNNIFIKKNCMSNSRTKNQNKNSHNNNNNLMKKNISSKILYKSKKNSKNKKKPINSNYFREEKKIFKCQINKQAHNKLINNYNPDSINRLYSNNISYLNIKNKNNKNNNNNTFNKKNKVINNYNILNGNMNNSTQINIYTGNDLIKSLNLYLNSIINSTKSPSGFYENNLYKIRNQSRSLSKKNKKLKNDNLKKFIERHIKEKNSKEPYTERNSNNEKFLKLLDIYYRDSKKYKSTNLKKNISKNKLNKSHNHNSKSILEVKSMGEYNKKYNNEFLKEKEKNNNGGKFIHKKFSYYKSKNIK